MTVHRRVAVSIAVLMLTASVAAAAGGVPCLDDVKKFCAKEPAGGGRIQACLKKHDAELSATCKSQVANFQQEVGTMAATCQYDIIRFCSDVQPGGGRVVTCLQTQRDDLSPECKNVLPKQQ
jgi:cysteine rich repeat protein